MVNKDYRISFLTLRLSTGWRGLQLLQRSSWPSYVLYRCDAANRRQVAPVAHDVLLYGLSTPVSTYRTYLSVVLRS